MCGEYSGYCKYQQGDECNNVGSEFAPNESCGGEYEGGNGYIHGLAVGYGRQKIAGIKAESVSGGGCLSQQI